MTTLSEKEQKAEAVKARSADMERREKELNKDKAGVGTRVFIAMTRGKNPTEIQYEAFDESLPDTLPRDIAGFLSLTGLDPTKDEAQIVSYLIGGYNDAAYTAASDPLKEYVDPSWPDDAQVQFRIVVRNYSRGANTSLEDAVALIKPGFVKQFSTKA